jgi:hypothetical protein
MNVIVDSATVPPQKYLGGPDFRAKIVPYTPIPDHTTWQGGMIAECMPLNCSKLLMYELDSEELEAMLLK